MQDSSGSPAERFFGRSPRSCLPNSLTRYVDHSKLIEARKQKQVDMATSKGRSAPNDFREGDVVLVQDMLTKKWNISGTVKQARIAEDGSTRSFIIEREDGALMLRNCKYLKHSWKNPRRHVSWADKAKEESADTTEQSDQATSGL